MKTINLKRKPRKKIFNRDEVGSMRTNWFYATVLLFLLGILLGMILREYTDGFILVPREAVTGVQAAELPGVVQVDTGELSAVLDPSEGVTVSAAVKADPIPHIRAFRDERGGIDDVYLDAIVRACGEDVELVERVVAISVAECSMNPAVCGRTTNMWGWFKGGDRAYDPDIETMAVDICTGIRDYYPHVEGNPTLAMQYTGGDRVDNWLNNVRGALARMQELKGGN